MTVVSTLVAAVTPLIPGSSISELFSKFFESLVQLLSLLLIALVEFLAARKESKIGISLVSASSAALSDIYSCKETCLGKG
jgi:uncharacterized membrane protein YjjB (DUF3815 family)